MTGNFREFDLQLAAIERGWTPQLILKIMRALALKTFAYVVVLTPRKTGRAQNSWDVAINEASDFVPPEGADSYPPADVSRINLSGLKLGDSIIISSCLVYMPRLNDGSSDQAPAQFAESALMRAAAEIESMRL